MPIKPHKLGIIGVGRVGDAVLSDAMMSGLFGEICVIDVNEKLAAGQALDQHHATALPNVTNVAVYAGDYDDLSNADVIIMTAGPSIDASNGPATGAARRELAATNGKIIRSTMTQITSRNHDAAIIICSNPLDALVHIASTEFDHPQGLVLGTGTILVLNEHAVYPVCTTLHGQYGHDGDVSMGVPCVIGATGVERILEVPLDDWEQEHLASTIKAIQETVEAAS
ncbi:MAG: hypothetical protein B6I33_07730 [Propionibacterium sp. 4572_24]|nr:MAG: hypothetical protein B6I33_07730 [Propionibacterium sp. 4572_24]